MNAFDNEFATAARPDLLRQFGSTITYTDSSGTATVITNNADLGDVLEVPSESRESRAREFRRLVTISLADVAAPDELGTVTIDGDVWDILAVANKGAGMADLSLVRRVEDYVHGEGHEIDRGF